MPHRDIALDDKDKILHEMLASNDLGTFFGVSQKVLNLVWNRLRDPEGNSAIYISMEIGADPDIFHPVRDRLKALDINDSTDPQLDFFIKRFLNGPRKIPNYGGGLGVLAGDTLKSMAACKIPAVAISLLYRKGYFSQLVDSRIGQIAWATEWHPEEVPGLYLLKHPQYPDRPLEIEIAFFDEENRPQLTYAQIWMKMEINENLDYFIPELLS